MLQKTTNKPTTCQKDGSVRNNLLFFRPYHCANSKKKTGIVSTTPIVIRYSDGMSKPLHINA